MSRPWLCPIARTVALLALVVTSLGAQELQIGPEVERLEYRVRWLFAHLGTVTLTQHTASVDGQPYLLARMFVRSNPTIAFLDLDFVHETLLRADDLRIEREIIRAGAERCTWYVPCRESGTVLMIDSVNGCESRRIVAPAPDGCYDVNTLLLFTRRHATRGLFVSLPTAIDYAVKPTDIALTGRRVSIDVPAFSDDVRSRHFTGNAHWVGTSFAGMKGGFEGWVSDDAAGVPLRASVSIFVGSIVLELTGYTRPGWDTVSLTGDTSALVNQYREQP